MIDASRLPALNASLNAASALLLFAGWMAIRSGRPRLHAGCMVSAFVVSTVFLVSYLAYHAQVGSVRFTGQGWIRPVYFAVLLTHTILAASVPPLAIATIWRAARRRFDAHRRLARVALPIWLYVSVSGVAVYWMLYRVSW